MVHLLLIASYARSKYKKHKRPFFRSLSLSNEGFAQAGDGRRSILRKGKQFINQNVFYRIGRRFGPSEITAISNFVAATSAVGNRREKANTVIDKNRMK